ncbi:uncharacterized protein LOC131436702 [Malaya genurostris]|uniref:uncharacterized protein LOC131436702 n=1 Tax=Malaya genurostris TaxID=325434 RepID=UPI0026F409B5|nr:uncharacterized protein LOC131436702 [Malaya genurostris]
MDKFLRLFIKFHGYCIAVVSSFLTILFTSIFSSSLHSHNWEELYDLRYTGIPVLIFGLAWMVANSLLIIGIFKEKKAYLYPFSVLFLLDLLLVIIRDLYLIISQYTWYYTVFFNFSLPILLFIIPYVVLSILALMRLFDIDPIIRTDQNFVRFDRNSAADESFNGIAIVD